MRALNCLLPILLCSVVSAGTTINEANRFGYGANIGWMNWRGDTNNGAVIGEYVCSGYVWGANVGWLHLGSNTETTEVP